MRVTLIEQPSLKHVKRALNATHWNIADFLIALDGNELFYANDEDAHRNSCAVSKSIPFALFVSLLLSLNGLKIEIDFTKHIGFKLITIQSIATFVCKWFVNWNVYSNKNVNQSAEKSECASFENSFPNAAEIIKHDHYYITYIQNKIHSQVENLMECL